MSHLVDQLIFQIRALRLPEPELEWRFHPSRRWRFDIAWPDRMIAIEAEGGHYRHGQVGYRLNTKTGKREQCIQKSRHLSVKGFEEDCRKYAEAAVLGWRIYRTTAQLIKQGHALSMLERLFADNGGDHAKGRNSALFE